MGLTGFWLKLMISDEGRTTHRAGRVRRFLRQLTRNSNCCSQVHAPTTRIQLKPSFDQAVSGEDDRVPGSLSSLGGSWIAPVGAEANREPFLAIVCEFQREQNTEKRKLQLEVQFEKDREKHNESVKE